MPECDNLNSIIFEPNQLTFLFNYHTYRLNR